jgi:hypothetical protein
VAPARTLIVVLLSSGNLLQVTREVYGQLKVIELVPGGSQINVTQANKYAACYFCV